MRVSNFKINATSSFSVTLYRTGFGLTAIPVSTGAAPGLTLSKRNV